MTDLLLATQTAVFKALNVEAVTSLAPVFTNVPANRQPPFVEIGLIDAEDAGDAKMAGFEQHTIEIQYRTRGDSRLPLLALMHAGRTALEGVALDVSGAALEAPRWKASATDREDDAVTWHGAQRFELFAQQA